MGSPSILLYDNSCGVCHWLVRFVLRNDPASSFMFAPLDSRVGRELLARHHLTGEVDSVVVVHAGAALVRSDAVLRVLRELGGCWRILGVFRLLPRPWRDAGYDAFARRRSAVAQRLGLACELPTLETRGRFLN